MATYLTQKEAAEYLHISPDTLARRRKAGLITPAYIEERRIMYSQEQLDEWIKQRDPNVQEPSLINRAQACRHKLQQLIDIEEAMYDDAMRNQDWEMRAQVACTTTNNVVMLRDMQSRLEGNDLYVIEQCERWLSWPYASSLQLQ